MKYILTIFLAFWAIFRVAGQTPANDSTWQLVTSSSDEFNYTGVPDPSKWKMTPPWGPDSTQDNGLYFYTANGHNAFVNDSFLSLKMKRGSYSEALNFGGSHDTLVRRPYTIGIVSSQQQFQYGYIEAKIRMPDNYNAPLFGDYINNAFWGFSSPSKSLNIDWNDIDFEIVTDGPFAGETIQNGLECNSQVETPFGAAHSYDSINPSAGSGCYCDPAHFAFVKTDPAGSPYTNYCHRYFNRSIVFGHGWHIFGYERLPDQIKMYVDGQLWVRLEGNYPYTYTNVFGNPQTVYPVHNLIRPMWMIINNGLAKTVGDTAASGPDSLSVDVDYFRYYRLKQDCGGVVVESGFPVPYYLCGSGNYPQKQQDSVVLGQTGCATCDVEVGSCYSPTTRVTVRARRILLEDGFKVTGESEFYAHDIDTCP